MHQLVVMSRSIGRGVPTATREAMDRIVERLRAEGFEPTRQSWGLEGEQRVCVGVSGEQLAALEPAIEALASGVDLLNIEIQRDVEEPCRQAGSD